MGYLVFSSSLRHDLPLAILEIALRLTPNFSATIRAQIPDLNILSASMT
jgi:hypothetical protein